MLCSNGCGVEAKSVKGNEEPPQVEATDSLGILPPVRGIRTRDVSANSKTKNLPKILYGACMQLATFVSFQTLLRGLGFGTSRTLSMSRMHLLILKQGKGKAIRQAMA